MRQAPENWLILSPALRDRCFLARTSNTETNSHKHMLIRNSFNGDNRLLLCEDGASNTSAVDARR